jgi:hypothetical protein
MNSSSSARSKLFLLRADGQAGEVGERASGRARAG